MTEAAGTLIPAITRFIRQAQLKEAGISFITNVTVVHHNQS